MKFADEKNIALLTSHKRWTPLIALALFGVLFWGSCTTVIEDPTENPFNNGTDTSTVDNTDNLDPNSFEAIYRDIINPGCNVPTCHDGSFEPDYRTLESSYITLVYHNVFKNDTAGTYRYRVYPGLPDSSWLIDRLITEDPILGRMPLYAPPLDAEEMQRVRTWILNGAPNPNGLPAQYPNLLPIVERFRAYNQDAERLDNNAPAYGDPFTILSSENVELRIEIVDDSTATVDLSQLRIDFSTDPEDFTNATSHTPDYYKPGWVRTFFKATDFPAGTQLYFRCYANDGDNAETVEFPNEKSGDNRRGDWSFIIN